jgi:hypothetical protein
MLMLGMPILTPGTVNALSLLSINRLSIYKLPNLRIVVGHCRGNRKAPM